MTNTSLQHIDVQKWDTHFTTDLQNLATKSLEEGKVLYFPTLSFELEESEKKLLSPDIVDPKSKNISYDIKSHTLSGVSCNGEELEILKAMIHRFAVSSRKLLDALIPHYENTLIQAKTSFRPVEIAGRKSSWRKDDTRLHVDSFPSNPVQGQRILRFFTNINPEGKPRVWRVGEPFSDVVQKMAPRVSHPVFGVNYLLNMLGITKKLRSPYDHYMLQLHDAMKADMQYQKDVPQEEILFPAGSSWAVFTDQVSHAAMSGQHVLEQTYYLPPGGLKHPEAAPLAVLESYYKKRML